MKEENFWDVLFDDKKIMNLRESDVRQLPKEITVAVFTDTAVEEGSEEENLLNSILSACNLKPEVCCVLPLPNTYRNVVGAPNLSCILMFGLSCADLDLEVEFSSDMPVVFNNKIWIKTHPLTQLLKDPTSKKILWQQALKPTFIDA